MCNETKTCSRCGKTGTLDLFQPHHNYHADGTKTITKLNICKKCSNKEAWQRQKAIKFTDPVKYYTEALWKSLNQRCVNGRYANSPSIISNYQHISYHKKGIMIELTKAELKQFWTKNVELVKSILTSGGTPTIDRIDDNKHYTVDNIQVLDRKANITKSRGVSENPANKSKDQMKMENKKRYRQSHKKDGE